MYALFDDAGKFHAGRLLSEAEASVQLELETGKRVKVKAANVLLRFSAPAPLELLTRARSLSAEIDLDLAWEFAPEGDFGFADLAREYFSAVGPEHQAAALLRLFEAPHYFRRLGRGQFRKAPQEQVRAALLGIERKQREAEQIQAWALELQEGRCPDPVRAQIYRILFKPDKNSLEYRAVVEAARGSQRAPLALLQNAGAIDSPYQFHWRRFLFEQFPDGHRLPEVAASDPAGALPLAEGVQAFSIDDSATTEIDDALSVRGLGSGSVVLGIHIAAPGLAITPGDALDQIARARLSTVYMPGFKLTMLPDSVIRRYTLIQGQACPAVSLYVTLDESSLEIRGWDTRIERVAITTNLRHDVLDAVVTEASLSGQSPAAYPHADELAFCFRLARSLKAAREQIRGRPETFNRPDYSFRLEGCEGEPTGLEEVVIGTRRRGAPLDLIVSEAMILANSTWGGWLASLGVPAIYRSQAGLAPGIKVRMGTRPLPHAGMGVSQYSWSTSPLRRYVDLVNQWQIIACARHGATAALAAPFKPKDAELFSIISAFDAAYTAYNDFQGTIERYWTLRWLQLNDLQELEAAVMKEGLVRAEALPLVFRLPGTEALARGTRVRARVAAIDLLTLELHAQFSGVIESSVPAEPQDETEEDETAGATLALAIEVPEGAGETAGVETLGTSP